MFLNLETDRLILRPFEINDALEMFENWTSDPEVSKYVTWSPHENIEETKGLLAFWIKEYEKPERINLAIVLKDNEELIGGIDVVGYLDGIPVIGYVLSRKYWNQGIATEACRKLIDYLFSIGHNKIIIDAQVENIGSNKVIQKCGGIYQNTYEDYISSKDKKVNVNRYIIVK